MSSINPYILSVSDLAIDDAFIVAMLWYVLCCGLSIVGVSFAYLSYLKQFKHSLIHPELFIVFLSYIKVIV